VGHTAMVGKFTDIKDKWSFLQHTLDSDNGITDLMGLLSEDKRWLGALFENASKLSEYPDRAAMELQQMLLRARAIIKPAYMGAQIDEFLSDKILYPLNDEITGSYLQEPLLKYSKRMAAAAKIQYAYREDVDVDNDFILKEVAYHDPRWLSKLDGDLSKAKLVSIWRRFIGGGYQWSQELQDAQSDACRKVRKYVNIMCLMVLQDSGENPFHATAKKLVGKFKIDKYFDEETWELLDSSNFTQALHRYAKDRALGLLCAVDKSWPSYDPSIVAEAGPIVYTPKVFKSLTSMKIDEIDISLLSRIGDAVNVYDGDTTSVTAWFKEHPHVRDFLTKCTRRSNKVLYTRALFWLDKLKVADDKMQNIFDEMDDLGI